jgi:hypothetical protein
VALFVSMGATQTLFILAAVRCFGKRHKVVYFFFVFKKVLK